MLTTTQSYVTYQGNGATTSFPYNFYVAAAGYLVVSITNNNVNPAVTTILSSSQYSVSGIGNGAVGSGTQPGGTVTYPVSGNPLGTGWTITIQRIVPFQQGTSLTNQGAFYPNVVEAALDYLTMLTQQLQAGTSGTSPVLPAWISGLNTLTDVNGNLNSATPSLAGLYPAYKTANTSATTITGFTGMVAGHYFKIIFGDAHTTISFGTNIKGHNSQSWSPQVGDTMDCVTDGTYVYAIDSGTLATLQSYINSLYASAPPNPYRNRFINGDMRIDQRHNGASQTVGTSDSGDTLYRVDRWAVTTSGAAITAQQVAGSSPWKNYLQLTGAASNTGFAVYQRIESNNILDQAGQTVTLSAYVNGSSVTSLTWTAYYPTATDNYSNETQIATGSWTITGSLSRYSTQINLPSNAVNGVSIVFSGAGLGANQTVNLTGAQLEPGSTMSPFEVRPLDVETFRCGRYLPMWKASSIIGSCYSTSSSAGDAIFNFNPVARVTPTGIVTSGTFTLNLSGGTNSSVTPALGAATDNTAAVVVFSGGSGLTANQPGYLTDSGGVIYFTGCEL
jgi:hypothetical protein